MCAVVSVGTWNLENLFRPGGAFGPRTQQAFDDKLDALRAEIERLAPDALAVQEVGDPAALQDLVSVLSGRWHTGLSTVFDQVHPIRVGFISRLALTNVEDVNAFQAPLRAVQTGDGANDNQGVMGRGARDR